MTLDEIPVITTTHIDFDALARMVDERDVVIEYTISQVFRRCLTRACDFKVSICRVLVTEPGQKYRIATVLRKVL